MNKLILASILVLSFSCKDQVGNVGGDTDTTIVTPVTGCEAGDDNAPVHTGLLTLAEDSSTLAAPTISFDAATDDCGLSHYELSIGTSLGGNEVLSFTNIGLNTSYQQNGLNLDYSKDYYYSVRAVDSSGNISSVKNSSSWTIFTPKSLTNLVVWLDASQTDTISDNEGDHPGEANFSNDVKTWNDISGSSALHSFSAADSARPNWDVVSNAVRFNGSNQFMATANHADINLSTVGQRTLTVSLETNNDVNTRQLVFEEGGTSRGINIYIENGDIHCGYWNNTNDGDGVQAYTEVSGSISENSKNIITYLYDYSNYSGPSGANGTVECFVNGNSIGSTDTTSRLFGHSGDIGLGAVNQQTVYASGPTTVDGDNFKGVIYEFLMYNSAHSEQDITKLYNVLSSKNNQ
jgi:hypothetical protein